MLALELPRAAGCQSSQHKRQESSKKSILHVEHSDQLTLVFFFSRIKKYSTTQLYRGYPTVDGSEIRLTSWYGKYPMIFMVSYIPGGCFGCLNHQQYGTQPSFSRRNVDRQDFSRWFRCWGLSTMAWSAIGSAGRADIVVPSYWICPTPRESLREFPQKWNRPQFPKGSE